MNRRRLLKNGNGGITLDPVTRRGMVGEYEVVDLGLPSGTLWATRNVGANSESEGGNYYPFGQGGSQYPGPGTYVASDIDILTPLQDTATVLMGECWHMPTKEQLQELISNTTLSDDGHLSAVFTSKVYPNAYIIFPKTGYYHPYYGEELQDSSYSYIWSCTNGSMNGCCLKTFSKFAFKIEITQADQRCGMAVRGVISL